MNFKKLLNHKKIKENKNLTIEEKRNKDCLKTSNFISRKLENNKNTKKENETMFFFSKVL